VTPRLLAPRRAAAAACAAAALAAACAPDAALDPARTRPARLVLVAARRRSRSPASATPALVVARVLDAAGAPVPNAPVRWSVRGPDVVRPDGAGVFRAVGNGRVTVVAELDPGHTRVRPAGYYAAPIADSVVLEVRQRAARLALAPVDTAFATLGAARPLRVLVADARGNPMPDTLAAASPGSPTTRAW
jgi:hypothetical protein